MKQEYIEVLDWLRSCERDQLAASEDPGCSYVASQLGLAIELIKSCAVDPIPLSERKPWSEHCLGRPTESSDAGWLWLWFPAAERWQFCAVFHRYPARVEIPIGATHWLPSSAKYLPARLDG